MEEQVNEIYNKIQNPKTLEHVVMENIATIETLVKNNTKEMIDVLESVYGKVAKFATLIGKKRAEIVQQLLRLFSLLVRCVNGVLTGEQKELMTNQNNKTDQQFENKVLFNEGMIRVGIDISMSKHYKSKFVGIKMLHSLIEAINLEENSEQYSIDTLVSLLSFVVIMIKDRNKIWIQEGIKISSYLKLDNREEFKQLKFVLNAFLINIINDHKQSKLRLYALSQIDLTPQVLNGLSSRIADNNMEVRNKFLERIKLNKICPTTFDKCSLFQMIYFSVNDKNDSDIMSKFCQYISLFLQNQKNSVNALGYKQFLQLLNTNLLMYYPRVAKALQNFIVTFFKSSLEKQIVFDKYIRQICVNIQQTNQCTDQIFYVYVAANQDNDRFDRTLSKTFPNGVELAQLIQKAFRNYHYFQVIYLLELSKFNINSDSVGRQKIFQSLQCIIDLNDYYQVKIPDNCLIYPNIVCPFKQQKQFEAIKYLKKSNHPVTNTNDILLIAMKQMCNIHKLEFIKSCKNVADNIIKEIESFNTAIDIQKQHLNNAQKANNSFLTSAMEENVEQFKNRIKYFREKLMTVALALYGFGQQSSSKLYKSIMNEIQDNSPKLIWILKTFFLTNRISKNHPKWVFQFYKLYKQFKVTQSNQQQKQKSLFMFDSFQKPCNLAIFNKYNIEIHENIRRDYFTYVVELLLSQNTNKRSLGIKACSSFLVKTQNNNQNNDQNRCLCSETTLFITIMFLLKSSSGILFKDNFEIESLLYNLMQNARTQLFMAHLHFITILLHIDKHNLELNSSIIQLQHVDTSISNLIKLSLFDFLDFQLKFYQSAQRTNNYLSDAHDHIVLLLSILDDKSHINIACKTLLKYPLPYRQMRFVYNNIIRSKLGDESIPFELKIQQKQISKQQKTSRAEYTIDYLKQKLSNSQQSTIVLIDLFQRYNVMKHRKKVLKQQQKHRQLKQNSQKTDSQQQTGSNSLMKSSSQSMAAQSRSNYTRKRLNLKK